METGLGSHTYIFFALTVEHQTALTLKLEKEKKKETLKCAHSNCIFYANLLNHINKNIHMHTKLLDFLFFFPSILYTKTERVSCWCVGASEVDAIEHFKQQAGGTAL
jgi:hypothetical protein